jgi:uncharacterized protein
MEAYTIPFGGQSVVYLPRRHLAFIGNASLVSYLQAREGSPDTARNPRIEEFLEVAGFDRPGLECEPVTLGGHEPCPTGAVLLMTNRCNMRCVYCYANAGDDPHLAEMDWPTAKAAIDYVLANAQHPDAEPPSVTFHGGGEPTVHWDLMTRAVEYARARDERCRFSMSSNGVWSDAQRQYVCAHFSDVSLSMDGAAAVQNRQRPRVGGGASFPTVMESIGALDEAGVEYGIRMTVMEESVDELPQGVRFVCHNTAAAAIQVEPTFTSSRGRYADIRTQFADVFSARFLEAWRIGRDAGRQVYYSGARPWVIAPMFCQAPLKAAVVTADGRLVTCFEVFSEQSPMAGGFTVGRVAGERVEYDRAALQTFLDTQQARRQECLDCFCYWHCCGDCATRRPGARNTGEGRCRATRSITLALLLEYIEEGGGVWQGLRETLAVGAPGCEDAGLPQDGGRQDPSA